MKSIFDKLIYKHIVGNFLNHLNMEFFSSIVPLKRNEALLFCYDLIPQKSAPHITEINTNVALDDDIVDWFDYQPLMEITNKWQYDNVIVLVEESESITIENGRWFEQLQVECTKNNKNLRIQKCNASEDIWDFKYNKSTDFILRIAWDKNCLIDKFAADKLKLKKFLSHQTLQTPNYGTTADGFKKGKYFVFKKSKIDKKNGVLIKKFNTKKEFIKCLKDYDYVEEYIKSDPDYQSGSQVEIKHYCLYYKNQFSNMTPNIYSQLFDYKKVDNELLLNRINYANLLFSDDVGDDYYNSNIDLPHPFHYRFIRINDEFDFTHCASVLQYRFERGDFLPIHMIEVGDILLRNGKKVKVQKVEVIEKQVRVKAIKTEENVIHHNGFQIQAKHENFIFGSDNIITNPLKGQGVLSSKEEELVEAIMAKAADSEMPERVVEITFECQGTYFTSEFLFEKPLKVINSMDYDIRMDRTDGREEFGTHNTAGVERKEPTFGWASYRPDLTFKTKRMEVMKLRPGMVCLTPKNRDMTIVRGLYGGFVPCRVVSMKEVPGKKSHWDIYEILPTHNYFMNRLHVHNGPANYSLTNGPVLIGHWDIGHASSFSSPDDTVFDLTSRMNADLTFHNNLPAPQSQPNQTVSLSSQSHNFINPTRPNPEFKAINLPTGYKGARLTRQPSNPYHEQYAFNSQYPLTVSWSSALSPFTAQSTSWPVPSVGAPNSPTVRRWSTANPGTNWDVVMSDGGNTSNSRFKIYSGNAYATVPTGFLWNAPSDQTAYANGVGGPKGITNYFSQKFRFHTLISDQSSPYFTFYGNWKKPSAFVAGSWGNSYNVPTPQANPRGPSQNFAFGGHGYPNPTANDGAWAWDKIFMYNQGNVSPETQWQQVVDGYPNSDYFYRTDNPSFVGSPNYTGGGP